MSENTDGNQHSEERPRTHVVDGELPADIVELMLLINSYHDARSEGDHDRADEIKTELDNPDIFPQELIDAIEEARKRVIRSPWTDRAQ